MMKISGSILAILVPTWSVVQAPPPPPPPAPVVFENDQIEKSDTLIGTPIFDSHDQEVGKVSDLAIDLEGGHVAEILVDTGGHLTSKRRVVAVPPAVFSISRNELRMSGDVDAFENAPEFRASTWNNSTSGGDIADVYQRFHVAPYRKAGPIKRASHLNGLAVRNMANEHLGKIDSLVIALPSGQIPEVILAPSGFLGRKGELAAMPPQSFLVEADSDTVILDSTRDAIKAAPHFKASEWRGSIPAVTSANDSARMLQLMQPPSGSAPPALDLNSNADIESASDILITEKIEDKILAAPDLSADARRVQVSTHSGRVTLRGIADSLKEKQRLSEIAATIVPKDHIDSQVQVKALAIAKE